MARVNKQSAGGLMLVCGRARPRSVQTKRYLFLVRATEPPARLIAMELAASSGFDVAEVNFVGALVVQRLLRVRLLFNRWFNKPDPNDNRKNPSLHGARIKSAFGLRLVELRTDPEGSVFHHWEFLSQTPPTEFTLRRSKVSNMPADVSSITVMAEDSYGNIMKKRFKVDVFV
ncbi:uncharacterized protein LOC118478529 [Aplysia californica]|uniref:Uncharacterized protein LOC118478529 n=1 Tax=Aplysia californica TaxID=6500 RepID=A0ABM1W0M2_APLCA|nr:uncharacterized protein LOC118478529 [Aplysia californica]